MHAYRDDGLTVDTERQYDTFARLAVTDGVRASKVELGVDWRANEPILMAVGPVLHPDDAVANRMRALYGRAFARDFIRLDNRLTRSQVAPQPFRAAEDREAWCADLRQAIAASPRSDRHATGTIGKPQVVGLRIQAERRVRKPMLYPLSYEGARAQSNGLRVDPGWQGVACVDLSCPGWSGRRMTTRRSHGPRLRS